MPREFVAFGKTFERHHPGWQMKLWTEANLPPLRNRLLFDRATSPAQKADIARYEVLYEHGGVYVDTDFECKRSIEPLLSGVTCFAATEDEQWVSIGILGASVHHPLFAALIEELPRSVESQPNAPVNVQTGPLFFTRIVTTRRLKQRTEEIVVFPPRLFYPYPPFQKHRRNEEFPEAYAVHHWAGSWLTHDDEPRAAGSTPGGTPPTTGGGAAGAGEPEGATDSVFRVLLGIDPDAPESALVLLMLYRRLFAPSDPVELGIYAYAEPSLPLLQCIQELIRILIGDVESMARLNLYSKAELASTSYRAAFFPSGDLVRDARATSEVLLAMHAERARLDRARRESAALAPSPPPARADVLALAGKRPVRAAVPSAPTTGPATPARETPSGFRGTALGDGRVLVRTTSGFPLLASANDLSLTPELMLNGEYDAPLTRFLDARLAPGQVAFDIGANVGLFTLQMAHRVGPKGRVVAYEANPPNAALLRDNVAINYVSSWTTVLELAAWSSSAELTFHAPNRFRGNGSIGRKDAEYLRMYPSDTIDTIQVKAEPASRELAAFPRVDLVKIDVEGAEYEVLSGMRQDVESGRVRALVFECLQSLLGADFARLVDLLRAWERLGFRCHTLDDSGRPSPITLARVAEHGRFSALLVERQA